MKVPLKDGYLYVRCEGNGQPVLLLHGQPGHSGHWEPVISLLSKYFCCIAPDRPGYGRSSTKAKNFKGNAEDLLTLMDFLSIEQASVVGHSWGGGVALALAQNYPERVKGLVLIASVGTKQSLTSVDYILAKPIIGELISYIVLLLADRALPSFVKIAQKVMLPNWFNTRLNLRRVFKDFQEIKIACPPITKAAFSSAKEQRFMIKDIHQIEENLNKITCPTLVIAAGADNVVPAAGSQSLTTSIKNSTFEVIEDASHLLIVETPVKVSNLILSFLSNIK
jgi:pimeloyl-ACP methyl ester carboxylesterase